MRRFFLVEVVLTVLLLGGKVQAQNGLDTNLWMVEDHSGKAQFQTRGDTIEISTPKGLTLWYKPRLTGSYEITYSACMPMNGDPNDRLSDLNCFWGANDPQYPDNLFQRSAYRKGIFQRYKTLTLTGIAPPVSANITAACPDRATRRCVPSSRNIPTRNIC